MGLQKTIQSKGIDLTYWKLIEVNINKFDDRGKLYLAGYVSKEARDANIKNAIDGRNFPLRKADLDAYFGEDVLETDAITSWRQAYKYITELTIKTTSTDDEGEKIITETDGEFVGAVEI